MIRIQPIFKFLDTFHDNFILSVCCVKIVILYIEGYIDISNNSSSELIVTCKVGPTEYKKNYVYLNDYTLYVVEDINGTHTDPYHYKVYFHTDVLPSVEVRP